MVALNEVLMPNGNHHISTNPNLSCGGGFDSAELAAGHPQKIYHVDFN
jgi:hypothetical protein